MSKEVKELMIKIGRAMLTLGLQNTHCGNISARVDDEIYITKTGSMKGHLAHTDIVTPGLFQPKSGLFQASSETGTHQKILSTAGSAIHAHSLPATLISYHRAELLPVDIMGKKYLKQVPVVQYKYPVGSKEMELGIPKILKSHPAMIIKTHGPMVRGKSLEEAFFLLNLVDFSAEIQLNLDLLKISGANLTLLKYPELKEYVPPSGTKETRDKEIIRQFKMIAADMFKMKMTPIHTGSISVRDGNEMLLSPMAAMPDDFENDIFRLKINQPADDFFDRLHQVVYQESHAQSAVFTHSPQAIIQGFYSIMTGEDRIIPIDAEGGYLYPAIPILMPDEPMKNFVKKAEKYKMVLIAGVGVLAIGHTPSHCIHHNSSLKNISYLKTQLQIMQQSGIIEDTARYLDERGKEW